MSDPNVLFVQYNSTGVIVGSGICPTANLSQQAVPPGGGVLQTATPIYPPAWANYKVVNGALTPVG